MAIPNSFSDDDVDAGFWAFLEDKHPDIDLRSPEGRKAFSGARKLFYDNNARDGREPLHSSAAGTFDRAHYIEKGRTRLQQAAAPGAAAQGVAQPPPLQPATPQAPRKAATDAAGNDLHGVAAMRENHKQAAAMQRDPKAMQAGIAAHGGVSRDPRSLVPARSNVASIASTARPGESVRYNNDGQIEVSGSAQPLGGRGLAIPAPGKGVVAHQNAGGGITQRGPMPPLTPAAPATAPSAPAASPSDETKKRQRYGRMNIG